MDKKIFSSKPDVSEIRSKVEIFQYIDRDQNRRTFETSMIDSIKVSLRVALVFEGSCSQERSKILKTIKKISFILFRAISMTTLMVMMLKFFDSVFIKKSLKLLIFFFVRSVFSQPYTQIHT